MVLAVEVGLTDGRNQGERAGARLGQSLRVEVLGQRVSPSTGQCLKISRAHGGFR